MFLRIHLNDDRLKHAMSANETPPYSSVDKLLQDLFKQIDLLVGCEDEIVAYLEESFSRRNWGENVYQWFGAAVLHPSPRYVDYLLKILAEPDASFPHWAALDTLAYMPQEISKVAVPELIQLMETNNPAWSEDVKEKFFETLLWTGHVDSVSYILKSCDSSDKTTANIAKDFVERFELDQD